MTMLKEFFDHFSAFFGRCRGTMKIPEQFIIETKNPLLIAELSDPFEQSLFKKMTFHRDLIRVLNSLPHQKKRKRELVHFFIA